MIVYSITVAILYEVEYILHKGEVTDYEVEYILYNGEVTDSINSFTPPQ